LALAANKCDMVDKEVVDENEAKKYAKEIGAIFQVTSAKENIGIDFLFKKIINKLLEPNYDIESDKINIDELSTKDFKPPNKQSGKTIIIKEGNNEKSKCALKKICKG